jgi:YVTN family beta-propeller protein
MRLRVVAVLAAGLIALILLSGCGDTFRVVVTPTSGTTPVTETREFAAVLSAASPDPSSGLCNDGSSAPCAGAVSQIDVSGDTNLGNETVGAQTADASNAGYISPFKMALLGQDLFVVNSAPPAHSLSYYYPTVSTTFTTVGLPDSIPVAPVATSFTTSGTTKTSQVYVAGYNKSQVYALNSTGTLLATLTVGTNPIFIAASADGSKLYVANNGSNNVTVIAAADNSLNPLTGANIAVGVGPLVVVTNSNSGLIYVLNGDSTISTIDPTTDTVIATTTPSGSPSGAMSMAFDAGLNRLYVPNKNTNNVTIYDASSRALAELSTSPITVGTAPVAVAPLPDGSRAYVVNTGNTTGCNSEANSGRVSVINASSFAVSCITVGQTPVWIAASTNGAKVYVPHQGLNLSASIIPGTTVIRTANNLVITDIAAPAENSEACITNPSVCNYMTPFFVITSD